MGQISYFQVFFISLGYQSIRYLLFFISQIFISDINNLDFIDFVRKISWRLKKQKENKYQSGGKKNEQ
jgi:hypothetical protein